jgi:hypothetical protein
MKSLKNIVSTISLAGLAALAAAGCAGHKSPEKDWEVNAAREADHVFVPGVSKDFRIHLTPNGGGIGPEIRIIDTDGDGKTVEQYVSRYNTTGFSSPFSINENLLRDGARPVVDPENVYRKQRTMTAQEAARIDSIYQALLGMYHVKI